MLSDGQSVGILQTGKQANAIGCHIKQELRT